MRGRRGWGLAQAPLPHRHHKDGGPMPPPSTHAQARPVPTNAEGGVRARRQRGGALGALALQVPLGPGKLPRRAQRAGRRGVRCVCGWVGGWGVAVGVVCVCVGGGGGGALSGAALHRVPRGQPPPHLLQPDRERCQGVGPLWHEYDAATGLGG